MSEQHMIVIRSEAFGAGFDIVVEPAPAWTSFDAERPTHRSALRFAQSLRTVHGWKISDQSGDVA